MNKYQVSMNELIQLDSLIWLHRVTLRVCKQNPIYDSASIIEAIKKQPKIVPSEIGVNGGG